MKSQDRIVWARLISVAWIAFRRLLLWRRGLLLRVFFAFMFLLWLHSRVPKWVYWKAGLVFLTTVEIVYVAAVSASAVGIILLGFLARRIRRKGMIRSWLLRGMLLCVSVLLAAIAVEAASHLARSAQRYEPVPVGGLPEERNGANGATAPAPAADILLPTMFPELAGEPDIDIVVVGESSAREFPTTVGSRSGASCAGSSGKQSPGDRSSSTCWPVQARPSSGSTRSWPPWRGVLRS